MNSNAVKYIENETFTYIFHFSIVKNKLFSQYLFSQVQPIILQQGNILKANYDTWNYGMNQVTPT